MPELTQFQINSMRSRISVEVVANHLANGTLMQTSQSKIDAEVETILARQIEAATRSTYETPAVPSPMNAATLAGAVAVMDRAMCPPAPPAPAATYQPPAPRTESPRLPAGVFRAPPGSRIHPDGKIRTLGGGTFTPCSASGVRLHMAKSEPYPVPDWVCCKADG